MSTSMKSVKHIAALSIAALAIAISFSACNTIEGAGRDIKSTGKAIEKTAE